MISKYFHHVSYKPEQELLKDLTRECIFLRGHDFLYIPRENAHLDELFGEDIKSSFTNPVVIEMYCMANGESLSGSEMLLKFGMVMEEEVSFQVAKERFFEEIQKAYPMILFPREGDLIYEPLTLSLFEITFVDDKKPFFTTGIQTIYEIKCRKYIHNYDNMNVKIDHTTVDLDNFISNEHDINELNDIPHETNARKIQKESDEIMNFDETDPFSESRKTGRHY